MSSTSDSEEDSATKQMLLEAVDSTLLPNILFNKKEQKSKDPIEGIKELAKSQRFITHESEIDATDIGLSQNLQNHIFMKMSEIISKQVAFCDAKCNSNGSYTESCDNKYKSRLKLLKGAKHSVKPYEDVKEESFVHNKKPNINRLISNEDAKIPLEERLASIVQTSEDILTGVEIQRWAKPRERNDKLFRYTMKCGTNYIQEADNEFSKQRRKNNWSEAKIRK